jgi:thiamine transport system substrate-binding protein
MSVGNPGPAASPVAPPRTRWRPGQTGRWLAILAVVVALILAGIGINAYLNAHPSGEPTLTVYTYESLLGGCGNATLTGLIGSFEASHHVHVVVDCLPGFLSTTLIDQKASPSADVVIGLDEVTGPQADAAGVLLPYTPPEVADQASEPQGALAPDHSLTPYEYGYLGIDYTPAWNATTQGAVEALSLPTIAANTSYAKALIVEDPEEDITGEEFLLAEISFYQSVLHGDWTSFWRSVDPSIQVTDSWGDGYGQFTATPGAPAMLVSYSTDPAAAVSNGTPAFNATLFHWDGATYAWQTIYGIGIVKGTHHVGLAEAFEDWFLEGQVQAALPTSEWMYPANQTVAVPAVFHWAANASAATLLNPDLPLGSLPGALPGWIDQWQAIENQAHA